MKPITASICFFVVRSMPWLALKVLPAGYVGTSPWSVTDANTSNTIKAMSTGMYAFYQVRTAGRPLASTNVLDATS